MAEAGFLKAIYDSLAGYPVLQAAVGALILIFGIRLMMRADKVKEATASTTAPAPMPTLDATQLHLQGSVAFLDLMREKRDIMKESRDALLRIAECMRSMRDQSQRQTEILERIDREQYAQGKSQHHSG